MGVCCILFHSYLYLMYNISFAGTWSDLQAAWEASSLCKTQEQNNFTTFASLKVRKIILGVHSAHYLQIYFALACYARSWVRHLSWWSFLRSCQICFLRSFTAGWTVWYLFCTNCKFSDMIDSRALWRPTLWEHFVLLLSQYSTMYDQNLQRTFLSRL